MPKTVPFHPVMFEFDGCRFCAHPNRRERIKRLYSAHARRISLIQLPNHPYELNWENLRHKSLDDEVWELLEALGIVSTVNMEPFIGHKARFLVESFGQRLIPRVLGEPAFFTHEEYARHFSWRFRPFECFLAREAIAA